MMSTEQKVSDGSLTGYGYGWYVGAKRQPEGSIWHGGVQSGFTCDLWLIPKEHFALVILTNLEGGGVLGLQGLGDEIGRFVRTP